MTWVVNGESFDNDAFPPFYEAKAAALLRINLMTEFPQALMDPNEFEWVDEGPWCNHPYAVPPDEILSAIEAFLGRPLSRELQDWIPNMSESNIEKFGTVSWNDACYIYRRWGVSLGNAFFWSCPCECAYTEWDFYFTGRCPACPPCDDPPNVSATFFRARMQRTRSRLQRVSRIAGAFANAMMTMYNEVTHRPSHQGYKRTFEHFHRLTEREHE